MAKIKFYLGIGLFTFLFFNIGVKAAPVDLSSNINAWLNVANGVPQLDANGNITVPVKGDVSNAAFGSNGITLSSYLNTFVQVSNGTSNNQTLNTPNIQSGSATNLSLTTPTLQGGSISGTDLSSANISSKYTGTQISNQIDTWVNYQTLFTLGTNNAYTKWSIPVVDTASTYANLPTAPVIAMHLYCSDCYSKVREDGDTSTGIVVYWNGSSWRDALGILAQHP